MSDQLFTSVASIALAIIGLALVATLFSNKANTAGVIGAAGSALAQDIGAATAPVTGSGFSGSFSLSPSQNLVGYN